MLDFKIEVPSFIQISIDLKIVFCFILQINNYKMAVFKFSKKNLSGFFIFEFLNILKGKLLLIDMYYAEKTALEYLHYFLNYS